ncbi:hypothetical protein D3C72_1625350 [compost metagenome]
MVVQVFVANVQAAVAAQQGALRVGGGAGFAQRGAAFHAGVAAAAAGHEHHGHVIAGFQVGNAGAGLDHFAR